MNFTNFGSFFLGPFMALSAWFGFGHHVATTTAATTVTASTTVASHGTIHFPGSNGGVKLPHQPMHPVPAPTPTPVAGFSVTSLSPTSGVIGSQVTINGSGFASTSIVHFGGGAVTQKSVSADGTSITFTVPESVGPYCAPHMMCPMYMMLIQPGSYNVSVQNGETMSAVIPFTVTGGSTNTLTTKLNADY